MRPLAIQFRLETEWRLRSLGLLLVWFVPFGGWFPFVITIGIVQAIRWHWTPRDKLLLGADLGQETKRQCCHTRVATVSGVIISTQELQVLCKICHAIDSLNRILLLCVSFVYEVYAELAQ